MSTQRYEFQAEVRQLLDLVVHSLYSDKDVFLRELISNASDALDKLRFEQQTRPDLAGGGEPRIVLRADRAARTLAVDDNGIGMSRDEVVRYIGTIARSGTRELVAAVKEGTVAPQLIGQFGVGFYAAFMVADRVELVTRRAGEEGATRWTSTGDGAYTIEDATREHPGTTVTLHLKAADTERGLRDYADDGVLREVVKRYSDFVAYPIRLGDEGTQLNSQKAIWARGKGEVSDDEYRELYRHLAHDWTPPLRTISTKIEGTFEADALLFIPGKAPFDLYSPEMKRGVQLYVKRVFVMDECKELLPTYLRFVRGVVDAHDLPLNVSREILQKDRQLPVIRRQLVKKTLGALDEMKRDKPEDYRTCWTAFGPVLKEALVTEDGGDRDKVLDLVLAASTRGEPTSLADYVARMKEGQSEIYVLSGPSPEAVARSPLLEQFAAKGYEVLLFSDPIDELWLDRDVRYADKPLRSIARGDIQLGTEDERKEQAAAIDDRRRALGDLLTCLRVHLQEQVKDVRLSTRLTSSPACLVADEDDLTPRLQQVLAQLGQAPPPTRPILELNPDHPITAKLEAIFKADSTAPALASYARVLLGQAHLADSGQVPDARAFSEALTALMLTA